jgi:hypothetical protein
MRLWSSAQSSFGVVVAIVKLRIRSPSRERQASYNPAMAMRPPLLSPIAWGRLPVLMPNALAA